MALLIPWPANGRSAVGALLAAPAARNPKKTLTINLATRSNDLRVGGRVHTPPGLAVGLRLIKNVVLELKYH
jgi:hypothetical protein